MTAPAHYTVRQLARADVGLLKDLLYESFGTNETAHQFDIAVPPSPRGRGTARDR